MAKKDNDLKLKVADINNNLGEFVTEYKLKSGNGDPEKGIDLSDRLKPINIPQKGEVNIKDLINLEYKMLTLGNSYVEKDNQKVHEMFPKRFAVILHDIRNAIAHLMAVKQDTLKKSTDKNADNTKKQQAEINTLNKAIDTLNKNYGGLQGKLEGIYSKLGDMTNIVAEVAGKVETLGTDVGDLGKRVKFLENSVAQPSPQATETQEAPKPTAHKKMNWKVWTPIILGAILLAAAGTKGVLNYRWVTDYNTEYKKYNTVTELTNLKLTLEGEIAKSIDIFYKKDLQNLISHIESKIKGIQNETEINKLKEQVTQHAGDIKELQGIAKDLEGRIKNIENDENLIVSLQNILSSVLQMILELEKNKDPKPATPPPPTTETIKPPKDTAPKQDVFDEAAQNLQQQMSDGYFYIGDPNDAQEVSKKVFNAKINRTLNRSNSRK